MQDYNNSQEITFWFWYGTRMAIIRLAVGLTAIGLLVRRQPTKMPMTMKMPPHAALSSSSLFNSMLTNATTLGVFSFVVYGKKILVFLYISDSFK